MSENYILLEKENPVGILKLNRPKILNALSPGMLHTICDGLESFDSDPEIRVIVITGNDRAFAAGADIKAMADASPMDIVNMDTPQYWKRIRAVGKPLIAAVSGYAFGGGCELAMSCDLIVASETALFGQPEVKVGILPGAGGTQRLTKAIGPYRAMEMVLTGDPITAAEAKSFGLVNRVVPLERYVDEAKELARTIAQRPPIAIRFAREALKHGVETTLREGMELERKNYTMLFDTADQKEGMQAFIEKRPAKFTGK